MLLSAASKSQQSLQTVTRMPSSCIEFRQIFTCTDFNITWSVFHSRHPLPPPTNALLYPLSLRARVQIVRLTPGICWEHKTNSTSKHNFLSRDTSKAKQLYKSSPHNPITSFLPNSRHIQIQRPTVPPLFSQYGCMQQCQHGLTAKEVPHCSLLPLNLHRKGKKQMYLL